MLTLRTRSALGWFWGSGFRAPKGAGGGMWFEEPRGHIGMYWDISGCVGFGVPNFLYAGVDSALGSKMVGSCPSGLEFLGAQGCRGSGF